MAPVALSSGLSSDDVGTVAVVVIVAIVIIGLVLGLVMNKRIGRVVLAVIVIGLAVVVWTQRQSLQNQVHNCDGSVSFLGVHVNLSSDAQQRCGTVTH
jgi:hypothetical protein